jgi:hypothetical protein
MDEKYPRPWQTGPSKTKTVDFQSSAEIEAVEILDAGGEFLFTVLGAEKAREILLIVNGGDAHFDIDYKFTDLGGRRV